MEDPRTPNGDISSSEELAQHARTEVRLVATSEARKYNRVDGEASSVAGSTPPSLAVNGPGPPSRTRIRTRDTYFDSVQWTADGTSLIAKCSDKTIRTYLLPADIWEQRTDALPLEARGILALPESTSAACPSPYFSFAEPRSHTVLVGCQDLPVQLRYLFPTAGYAAPICTYKLIKQETEAYITPCALLWLSNGTHFVCGSSNRLDWVDISGHSSDDPVLTISTTPSRRQLVNGSDAGMRGMISALAECVNADPGPTVAAGTRTRMVGLYDIHRTDKAVATWSTVDAETAVSRGEDLGGRGVVQLKWSPCGRYMVINERGAQGLLVYDVRGTRQVLSVLRGRDVTTHQTLGCDVFPSTSGFETWAGNERGQMLVWENVGMHFGVVDPSWSSDAHTAPIGSTVVHPSGAAAATCSGGWHKLDDVVDDDAEAIRVYDEASLKVWTVHNQG